MQSILEYRLLKGEEFTPIYYYDDIEMEQILARRECEFFVKNGVTYKQTSSAIEDQVNLIYVEVFEEAPFEIQPGQGGIQLEFREYNPRKNHPLLKVEQFSFHLNVLHKIGAVYHFIDDVEWERDSAEIDEDRMTYVLYLTPTGYVLEKGERA
ncbi:hypothetical protein Q73_10635 [Bacillus coahuilensis m2-6]|uniref:Uncharacterized protein n=1 Tax=Bacillus coahuilensis p1.1.43 TaxID=1150625 RepID=A0A147K6T4_9BACI|nr:hypothetical protein [Bacillus coahuilensis]KUP05749.1 hypothetical protein Q75_11220 [Bacillus coahuilensis p1.1.43]KUP06786.1 hypothetical protein Q73_10635 [Bacillus coahuilensis m2-6]